MSLALGATQLHVTRLDLGKVTLLCATSTGVVQQSYNTEEALGDSLMESIVGHFLTAIGAR